jgi:hypothetical protein
MRPNRETIPESASISAVDDGKPTREAGLETKAAPVGAAEGAGCRECWSKMTSGRIDLKS